MYLFRIIYFQCSHGCGWEYWFSERRIATSDTIIAISFYLPVSNRDLSCSYATNMYYADDVKLNCEIMWTFPLIVSDVAVRRRCVAVSDVSIVGKPSIGHIHGTHMCIPYKKHNLPESISTSLKLYVPLHPYDGWNQTYPQEHNNYSTYLLDKRPNASISSVRTIVFCDYRRYALHANPPFLRIKGVLKI